MTKLITKSNSFDYYGFFVDPLFPLLGEIKTMLGGLYNTFSAYNVSLNSFRLEGDVSNPASAAILVHLGRCGNYRLKFDHVQVGVSDHTTEDVEGTVGAIKKGDTWLRETVPSMKFRTHVAAFIGHFSLVDTTSSKFLLEMPRRNTPVRGKDLGSGIVETWHDDVMDAKVRLTIDHSLQQADGLYLNYMITLERDEIDYVEIAQQSDALLNSVINELGLEFEGEES